MGMRLSERETIQDRKGTPEMGQGKTEMKDRERGSNMEEGERAVGKVLEKEGKGGGNSERFTESREGLTNRERVFGACGVGIRNRDP